MRRKDRGNPDPGSICLLCTPRPGNTKGEHFQPRGSGNVREFRPLPVAAEYRVLLATLLCGRLTCPVHCPGYGNGIPEKCAYILSIPSSQLCLCELQPIFQAVRSQVAFWEPLLEQGAPLFTPYPWSFLPLPSDGGGNCTLSSLHHSLKVGPLHCGLPERAGISVLGSQA